MAQWPCVWRVPLKTGFEDAREECPVVLVETRLLGVKAPKGLALIVQGVDSGPERVKCGGGTKVLTSIGSQVVVIEGEFVGTHKEVEDAGAGVETVSRWFVEVPSKDLMRVV